MSEDAGPPDHDPQSWRALVDIERLRAWMDVERLGDGPIEDAVRLRGGTQNLLLRFRRGAETYVLRRPPQNPYVDGDKTMRREIQVLGALASSDVPHPRLLAGCVDAGVLGSAFYVMAAVDGFAPPQGMPSLHASSPAVRHRMGLAAVDALGAIARIDYQTAGLGDFGRPEGFLQRQTARWRSQLESYEKYAGWTGRADLPEVDAIADWLERNVPPAHAPGLLHGDYHLGNLLFAPTGPEVVAVVDWEIATIGDPMLDLGGLLATWTDPDGAHPGCIVVTPWDGFPTEAELVARYASASGRDVAHVDWYVVLACFKLAIIQEGTYARAAAGQADPVIAAWMHDTSIKLLERARTRL